MKQLISFVLFLCASCCVAQIPTAGLLAHYPFVGNANDATTSAFNGTVNGASLTSDRFGNPNSAYAFNGTSDYIALPITGFVGLNIYSYSVWFKALSSTNNGRILCIGENGGLCQSITHQTAGPLFASGFDVGNTPSLSVAQSSVVPLNQWHHVVVTRDAVAIKMYLDGSLVTSPTQTATNGESANYGTALPQRAIVGGRSSLGPAFFFDGLIDDIRIYDVALTQTAVTALYDEPACNVNIPISAHPSLFLCSGQALTLTASATGTVAWYNSSTGSISLSGGTVYTTPALTSIATSSVYNYFAELNACDWYPRTAVSVTVNPLPSLSLTTSSGTICTGESATLSAFGASNYSWSPNAFTFSVIPSIVIAPTANTTYTLAGSDNNGCTSYLSYTQSVLACTGLEELSAKGNALCIFPSPAGNEIRIGDTKGTTLRSVWITDITGRAIYFSSEVTGHIDISALPPGVYYVRVLTSENAILNSRFVKE